LQAVGIGPVAIQLKTPCYYCGTHTAFLGDIITVVCVASTVFIILFGIIFMTGTLKNVMIGILSGCISQVWL
jgi:hypothetical protein